MRYKIPALRRCFLFGIASASLVAPAVAAQTPVMNGSTKMRLFVPPSLTNEASVFSANDFPDWLLQAGNSRIIRSRLYIRPNGEILRCLTENPERDNRLGNLTCNLYGKRARFVGAKWMDGMPVWGVYRAPVTWAINQSVMPYGDVELSVSELPKEYGKSATIYLVLAIDEDGSIVGCQSIARVPYIQKPPSQSVLTPPACKAIRTSGWKPVPPTSFTGKPVKSVQYASVRFSVQ